MRSGWIWAAAAIVLWGSRSPGQERQEQAPGGEALLLDPLVVTVTSTPLPLSRIPGSVGLIGTEELRLRTPVSVPNLFFLVPGAAKASDSLWGSDINIRGLSRESVVLLIDGNRVNTATDIAARAGLVDPLEVERVEVLRGPISSLYGSGSIGGVVNIITRRPAFTPEETWSGGLSLYGLSNPWGIGGFGYGSRSGPGFFAYASQTFREFDDFEDGAGTEMRNSAFEDFQTKLMAGWRTGERQRTEAQVQIYRGDEIGIPGSGEAPLPAAADVTYPDITRDLVSVTHTYEPEDGALQDSSLHGYYQMIERRVRIDNLAPASPVERIEPGADHRTLGVDWRNRIRAGVHELTAGIDVWRRDLDSFRTRVLRSGATLSDVPLPPSDFLSAGIYAEDVWPLAERLQANAGARADYIRVTNDETAQWAPREVDEASWNAHLGGACELGRGFTASLVAARAYRAASLEERYQYLVLGSGVTKLGDPDLESETSTFVEAGVDFTGGNVKVRVSAFHNELDDLIAERVVDETLIVNDNIHEAWIAGAEAEARWLATPFAQLYGNLAYARGRNRSEDEDLPGVPPLNGHAGVRLQGRDGLWGYTEVTFAASQDRVPPGVEESDAWATVDVRIGYDLAAGAGRYRVYAGVRNLLDEHYNNYLTTSRGYDFDEPGRSFELGCRAEF